MASNEISKIIEKAWMLNKIIRRNDVKDRLRQSEKGRRETYYLENELERHVTQLAIKSARL